VILNLFPNIDKKEVNHFSDKFYYCSVIYFRFAFKKSLKIPKV